MARYNANGSLDTTFNGTGTTTTAFSGANGSFGKSMAVQSDHKIVLVGYSSIGSRAVFALVRYNADGSLDGSFNGEGKVTTAIGIEDYAESVALQNDLKIVVAGWTHNGVNSSIAVVRYNSDGSLDTTFNGTGKVTIAIGSSPRAYSVKVMSDGKIVVGGGAVTGNNYDFVVVRYNADGSLDTTFDGTGKVTTAIGSDSDSGHSIVIQSDGKIVVAGNSENSQSGYFALVRYNTNGSLDTSFGGNGKVITDFGGGLAFGYSTVLQRNGKIVVAGSCGTYPNARFALARYEGEPDTDGDGILDIFETGTGIYVSPTDTGTSPTNPDSDGDNLRDGDELDAYQTNPNMPDTDGDGFDDGFEVSTGFSPTSTTSTPDTLSTALPAVEYRFNAANGISYRIEASTDLVNWTTIEANIIGTGGVITRFYSIEAQPRRFFRSRRN